MKVGARLSPRLRPAPSAARRSASRPVGLLAGLAGLAGLAVAGCTTDGSETGRDAASRSSAAASDGTGATLTPRCPDPPAKPRKTTVKEMNKLGAAIDLPTWEAGDIGASARLTDRRIVWLFGDTFRPNMQPSLVANSMLVTSGSCVSQLLDADKGPVIPDAGPRVVRWPMSVAVLPADDHDKVVVLTSRIDRGDSGPFGFTFLGTSAALFTVEPGAAPQLEKVVDVTPDRRDQQQVNWGAASTVDGKRFYIYGTRLTGEKGVFGRELHVARGDAADPANRGQWRFWDGSTWQRDPKRTAAVLPAEGGVSQTLSVSKIRGDFVAISKRDGDVGNFVYTWTAPGPTGPWTAVEDLEAPAGFDTDELEYAPLAHPSIRLKSGQLLVSISRNTTDLSALAKDPQRGRPIFVAVPR